MTGHGFIGSAGKKAFLLLLCIVVLGVAGSTGSAAAETVVSGASDHDSPLVIDPTQEPAEARVEQVLTYHGQTVMFIENMPTTKLVTRITLGDLAQESECKGAAVYSLVVGESPTGRSIEGTPNWLAKSLAPQALPAEPGKVTWQITPTVLRKGRGYTFVVESPSAYNNCMAVQMRTWTHNGPVVNGGPGGCDAGHAEYWGYRMWHEQGKNDAVVCFGEMPSGFDPSMPTGWLELGYYAVVYVKTLYGGGGSCNWEGYGPKPVFWRNAPGEPGTKEYVCHWKQFAAPDEEPEDGWYYAWGNDSHPGGPRDTYLKAWADEEDAATYYKPQLYFDTSESWRPLSLNRFFEEEYYGENPEGVPQHNVCTEGLPDPFFTWTGCYPVTAPDQLMGETLNDPEALLDVEGFGPNDEIEDYAAPGCSTEVELWDCDPTESAIYWRVTPGDFLELPFEEDAYRYVQYWMFYRVNSFSDAIDETWSRHEGDWEAVAIAPSHSRPGAFDFASFSQHGHWYSYLRENLSCWLYSWYHSCGTEELKSVGQPLEVFVANGSHANYGVRCSEEIEFVSCGQNASALPERGHDGAYGWTHNSPGAEGLIQLPTAPETWTFWQGHWGSEGGPMSPGWQSLYVVSWESCADDNDECPMEGEARRAPGVAGHRVARGRMFKGPFAERCGSWFGGDVPVLMCAPGTLASSIEKSRLGAPAAASVDVLRRGGSGRARRLATRVDESASAPGLSQAVGPPLRPGDLVRVNAPGSQRWTFYLRAVIGRRLVEARFGRIRTGTARLVVSDGLPALMVGGREATPVAIRARRFAQGTAER